MKKFTPILILIIMVGVVSVSGCIHYVDTDDNQTATINNSIKAPANTTTDNRKVNKSGNIKTADQSTSNNIKQNSKSNTNDNPKISREDIEKEIVRIMKLQDPNRNYTANATLINVDGKKLYLVDVYDDYGWYAYLEVDADNGPSGNDKDGYSFEGGAVRGETGNEPTSIQGVMPKISENDARDKMNQRLQSEANIKNPTYNIEGYLNDSIPFYNITINEYNQTTGKDDHAGYALMNANTGEIVYLDLIKQVDKTSSDNGTKNSQKVYSVDEAGAYVDMVYNGKKVAVRENYPYYSPQNDRIFYSQEEEAKFLSEMNME